MGSGSSTHVTEVESYGSQTHQEEEEEDVDAVATPLRPAYAPTSQQQTPTAPAPPASFAPWGVASRRGASSGPLRPRGPTQMSWCPTQQHPVGPSLPFQPTPPRPYAHMGYYPVAGTGVVLSRVVRALEATPPPYLLLPDHPNVPPSPPTIKHPPPVPPNTAHARRYGRDPSQYPGYSKPRASPTLGQRGVPLGTRVTGSHHQSPSYGE